VTPKLSLQGYTSRRREAFDRALQALPITQHKSLGTVPEMASHLVLARLASGVYRRYHVRSVASSGLVHIQMLNSSKRQQSSYHPFVLATIITSQFPPDAASKDAAV
jgi:hypothetical protein